MVQKAIGPTQGILNGWHFQIGAGSSVGCNEAAELITITPEEYDAWQAATEAADDDAVAMGPGDRDATGPYSNCRSNYGTPTTLPHAFTDGTDQPVNDWSVGINIQTGGLYVDPDDPEQITWLSNRDVCYVSQSDWKPGLPGLAALWVKLVVPGAPWNYPINYVGGLDTVTYDGSQGPNTLWTVDRDILTQSNWFPGAAGMETYYTDTGTTG